MSMVTVYRKHEYGISLIEVLVATSIFSFGMLGVAGMQASSLQNIQLSHQYSQAALLAQNMAERLRANRAAVLTGLYHHAAGKIPASPDRDCSKDSCTSVELANWDLAIWHSMVTETGESPRENIPPGPVAMLPSGRFSITCQDTDKPAGCSPDSVRLITVYWDSRRNRAQGLSCNSGLTSELNCFRLAYVP